MQVEGKNLLRSPGPMRAPAERRNMEKYCKFHKDRGHDTVEFQLRDQIEALVQEGYLQEYINMLVTAGRHKANVPHTMAPTNHISTSSPDDGPLHEVRTISGGHVASDLAKARKDSVQNTREIALDHQINMAEHVAKLSKKENTVISFTDDKAWHLIHPHTGTLVVTLSVANGKVFRILIDTRSSADILFASAFRLSPDERGRCKNNADQDPTLRVWWRKGLRRRSHPTTSDFRCPSSQSHSNG